MHFINSLLLSVVGNKAEQKVTFTARSLIINIFFLQWSCYLQQNLHSPKTKHDFFVSNHEYF